MEDIGTKIANLSLNKFNSLPKTGKPKPNEWTVLSCIVQEQDSVFEVVSLGTGSKCIGRSKMCPKGTVINDSHAELMCRRAFLRYLYTQLQDDSLIFIFDKERMKFSLKPNITFHFFTTHVPCGDAAIFLKDQDEDIGDIIQTDVDEIPAKKRKIDIFRTGAKCLEQDLKEAGASYHVTGVVRTKPGRGDPTASVSCSDKIAKWCHLGVQGALLMIFFDKPIYLHSFSILKESPFCGKALDRALFKRLEYTQTTEPYKQHIFRVHQVDMEFFYAKKEERVPCPSSISWFESPTDQNNLEVVVNGRKQGVTKKHYSTDKERLKICKLEIFKIFISKIKTFNIPLLLNGEVKKLTYIEAKNLSKTYQENWHILRKRFNTWTNKDPTLLHFLPD